MSDTAMPALFIPQHIDLRDGQLGAERDAAFATQRPLYDCVDVIVEKTHADFVTPL